MSTPVASASDLETYMGMATGTIDVSRASFIIGLAQDECESIVLPLPSAARGVVLSVAARAFNNPTSAHQMNLGSAGVSYGGSGTSMGIGGLYLSKADKATLRRLAGRGSAFTADTMPAGTSAVQTITVTATAGTFTISFMGATTAALAYNASAATVQSALTALSPIGAGNVLVTGSGSYVVTFAGTLATTPVPAFTVDGSALTGTVTVAQTVVGVAGAGQNMPPWGYDYYGNVSTLGSQIYGGY
jgi:hypothetical protein